MRRIFGKHSGKVIYDKNVGRNWLKGRTSIMPHQGAREIARRRRQIAAGQLTEANGLVRS